MKWYLCKYCNSTPVRAEQKPSGMGCPAHGTHFWNELCEVGFTNYYCYKCGTLIQGPDMRKPSNLACPSGQNALHMWYNLGKIGLLHYQCKVCGLLISCDRLPTSFGCKNNSKHLWNKL